MNKISSLSEVVRQSQPVFRGARFNVNRIQVEGKRGQFLDREFIVHPGATVILPLLDENTLVMIRNERFAIGQELWELPAGTLEPTENPEVTARRELIEETGYEARSLTPLLQFFTSPGFCNEYMHAYLATDLVQVGQDLEDLEKIVVETISWSKALKMIREGVIRDAKTLTTLLFYRMSQLENDAGHSSA